MILPVTDDRDSGPFFAAAREGKLVFRACSVCQRGIHPPVPFCTHCGGEGHWRLGPDARRQALVHRHRAYVRYQSSGSMNRWIVPPQVRPTAKASSSE